jgi:hypothetical protein
MADQSIESRKKMEEEARKRAEERLQKLEEERKRRIEEARKKMAEEENRRKEEIQRRAAEEESQRTPQENVNNNGTVMNTLGDDDIDLLGGLSETSSVVDLREQQQQQQQREKQLQHSQQRQTQKNKEATSNRDNTNSRTDHRDSPQRGTIDEAVDRYLDGMDLSVPVLKHGNVDGVYRFGARIMKTQLDQQKIYVVTSGNKRTEISTWIFQFEKTEMLRSKGFDSALHVITMMNATNPPVPKSDTTSNTNTNTTNNTLKQQPTSKTTKVK